ncbi:MAG: rhomboid family intramembrane serine protease [Flavobacteriales bacterium]|nr:rhomboid family intramembrane serine protease [Flavobacteriales bacterium]
MRIKPRVSAVLTITAVFLTSLLIFEPQLRLSYGVHDSLGVPFSTRMTVPFCHGYSTLTSILHLVVNVILMYFIASFLEKILGSFRFLIVTLSSYILYVAIHRLLLMIGHGLTPIIMTYSGMIFIVLFEGRYVKTNTVFDSYYKTLWGLQLVLWVLTPVIFSIIPIYFDAQSGTFEKVLLGNIANISCGILGIILGFIFREHIRKKLVQYTRKKYIKHDRIDDLSWYFSFGFILFLILKIFLF